MRSSIRLRLLWALLSAIFLISLASSIAVYLRSRSEINTLFDDKMEHIARILSSHLAAHPNLGNEPLQRVERDFVIQIWDKAGKQLYSSRPGVGPHRVMRQGFDIEDDGGHVWRTYTAPTDDYVLQIVQPLTPRRSIAAGIAVHAALPVIAIIPIGGIIVWLVVGFGLQPLSAIAKEVEARDPASMARIDTAPLPLEIARLAASLNSHFERLDRALKTERMFIADASHELRTPVITLKLQMASLEAASTKQEQNKAFQDFKREFERMEQLIEQLLTLARLDPESAPSTHRIDLGKLVRDVVTTYDVLAKAKALTLSVSICEQAFVSGDTTSVTALVRNILDNAIRYTPAGGKVKIGLHNVTGTLELRVIDSGPGIPAQLREKVFDRFFRVAPATEDNGTGLGLAIAQRASKRLGAVIQLADGCRGEGLTVLVRIPESATP